VLLATAYDHERFSAPATHLDAQVLARHGVETMDSGIYQMNFTATAVEVSRTTLRSPDYR
jgi:hypothetical protein